MRAKIKTERKVFLTLELEEQDFKVLLDGLANTSHASRVQSGMTVEQSRAYYDLYTELSRLSKTIYTEGN